MKRLLLVLLSGMGAGSASAGTYTATATVNGIEDGFTAAPVLSGFNFGTALGTLSATITIEATPCLVGPGCADTLDATEFFVFDFGLGDVQTMGPTIYPAGTFSATWTLLGSTLSDLADGLVNFTVGCDNTILVDKCSGVDTAQFKITVDTTMGVVPLPGGGLLMASTLGGLGLLRRRKPA